jgi:hypothetical protein
MVIQKHDTISNDDWLRLVRLVGPEAAAVLVRLRFSFTVEARLEAARFIMPPFGAEPPPEPPQA